ncbi:MAG TPA: hypothetical protein VM488_10350 [Pseudobacter sp.]|jgi:hypothetical protein|nr:hypothetical protein [Pseudobacter sp.]
MILIHGKRVSTKSSSDHSIQCWNCKDFDQYVTIHFQYYHVYLIPLFAFGPKASTIRCMQCGAETGTTDIKREFEKKARTPFYLYTGALLISALIGYGIIASMISSSEQQAYIDKPEVGDVYMLTLTDSTKKYYYFLKAHAIQNDTIYMYQNAGTYSKRVTGMDLQDFFNKTMESGISKQKLKELHDKDEIIEVFRNYGSGKGFDREQ